MEENKKKCIRSYALRYDDVLCSDHTNSIQKNFSKFLIENVEYLRKISRISEPLTESLSLIDFLMRFNNIAHQLNLCNFKMHFRPKNLNSSL